MAINGYYYKVRPSIQGNRAIHQWVDYTVIKKWVREQSHIMHFNADEYDLESIFVYMTFTDDVTLPVVNGPKNKKLYLFNMHKATSVYEIRSKIDPTKSLCIMTPGEFGPINKGAKYKGGPLTPYHVFCEMYFRKNMFYKYLGTCITCFLETKHSWFTYYQFDNKTFLGFAPKEGIKSKRFDSHGYRARAYQMFKHH